MDLFSAVEKNDVEKVQELLSKENIDINYQNRYYLQWTPLHYSCSRSYIQIVKLLLKHKHINLNLVDSEGQTTFLIACSNGKTEIVRILLQDARVDVNFSDRFGWTPLMYSCLFVQTLTVQELAKCHNRINLFAKTTKDYHYSLTTVYVSGSTALDIAMRRGNKDIIQILEEEKEKKEEKVNELKQEVFSLLLIKSADGNLNSAKLIVLAIKKQSFRELKNK